MEKIFINKTVIITGAANGIGKATAIAFGERGANVVVADIVGTSETVNAITLAGGKAIGVKCDISKESDVKAMVEKTIATYGKLDYAFNNAGIEGVMTLTQDYTEEAWQRTIDVNLKGVWLCMKYEILEMLKTGGGSIVNCASIAGLVGFFGASAYVASKHGVVGMTKTAALENAKTGIRINAICPGVIHTPMIDRYTKGDKQIESQLASAAPMSRMGQPEEIADAVIWLCNPGASFVTGQAIAVDGGWTTQ